MPPQNPGTGKTGSGSDERLRRLSPRPVGPTEALAAGGVPTLAAPADTLAASLVNAQIRMIQKYFQLQRVERRLSREACRARPGSGRKAIQQIELERQRLGRELHTGIGQILAATHLQLETIEQQWPSRPQPVQEALDRIALLVSHALDQVRAVSRRLHPPEWQRLSLAEALRQLWKLSGIPERTAATIVIPPELSEPELETKILLYRALQEALSNISLHAHATAVSVSLEQRDGRVVLTVRDNGVGFDPQSLRKSPADLSAGIGLRAMSEQAVELGGELTIRSGAAGTILEVSIPTAQT